MIHKPSATMVMLDGEVISLPDQVDNNVKGQRTELERSTDSDQ